MGDSLKIKEHQNGFIFRFRDNQRHKFTFSIKILGIKIGINCQITTSGLGIVEEPYLDQIKDISPQAGTLCLLTDSQTSDFEGWIRRPSFRIRYLAGQTIPYCRVSDGAIYLIKKQTEIRQIVMRLAVLYNVSLSKMLLFVEGSIGS